MKTFLVMAIAGAMAGSALAATPPTATSEPSQTYSYRAGTNTSSHDVDSQLTKAIPSSKRDVPKGKFSPRETGVFSDVAKHGAQAVNPLAPPRAGYGEKNLTAAVPANNTENTRQSPGTGPEFGGLKLFGWDF